VQPFPCLKIYPQENIDKRTDVRYYITINQRRQNMAELIEFFIKDLPKLRVVGKTIGVDWQKIGENNPIPAFWDKCFKDGTFAKIEENPDRIHDPSYVGYMTMNSYTCGMLVQPDFPVPKGYQFNDLEPVKVAIGWIKGQDKDVFMNAHSLTDKALRTMGYIFNEKSGWSMELYNCPRFTERDAAGNVIMDYYIPVQKA